jgi:hypothetical protein
VRIREGVSIGGFKAAFSNKASYYTAGSILNPTTPATPTIAVLAGLLCHHANAGARARVAGVRTENSSHDLTCSLFSLSHTARRNF